MAFQCLDKLTFINIPKFYCSISTAWNKISRVAGKLTVPDPFEMTFQDFVLKELKLVTVRNNFVKFDFLICRTGCHEFVIGRNLTFENVILMCLYLFVSDEMLSKRLDPAFTISEYNILTVLTDWYWTNADLIFA